MSHHTKDKGDLAVALTIADLTRKGYAVFTSLSEHLPFDLIAYRDGKCNRIQVKYATDGTAKDSTSWADKQGNHRKEYSVSDFDYYAVYLPEIDVVVYPSVTFRGSKIRGVLPDSATPFYWWEDFKEFTDSANKRTFKEFNHTWTGNKAPKLTTRKVERPDKETLEKLVWELPTTQIAQQYGVSDVAVSKWCRSYGIEKPKRGHWSKQ